MTKGEKIQFIDDLVASVHAAICAKVDAMPEEWDGHELRRYIADKFEDSVVTVGRDKKYKLRFRAYRNAVITRNL